MIKKKHVHLQKNFLRMKYQVLLCQVKVLQNQVSDIDNLCTIKWIMEEHE